MTTQSNATVGLPKGESGSQFFHRILSETAAQFPKALELAHLPTSRAEFKKSYGDDLCRFEAARIGSPQRVAIARHLSSATLASLRYGDAPLLEALQKSVPAPPVSRTAPSAPTLHAEVPFEGRAYRDREVASLAERLFGDHHLTAATRDALLWIVEHIAAQGGTLDLRGQRFALLGASAEISPAPMLLAAGAEVLWIDMKTPPQQAGVTHPAQPSDLLGQPQTVAAMVRQFAADGPVHLGLLAYAPGKSRELGLAAVMNALVQTLGPQVVRSVFMFISPTSPAEMQPEDLAVVAARARSPALWQRALVVTRVLKQPGFSGHDRNAVSRAIISLQGQGYQAAQYFAKIASAEAWAADGLAGTSITVSANVAGITNTRSLAHPLFQLAFEGASAFGIRVFATETTRALAGLLMLHDILNPNAPGAAARAYPCAEDKARTLRSQQIHGGVYDLAWQFDSVVRVGAVIGMSRRPNLLWKR